MTKQLIPQEFTIDEVALHNKPNDAWVIYKDKVFDITPFMNIHPGGQGYLINELGKDITTSSFTQVHVHSENAFDILDNFEIGRVKGKKPLESTQKTRRKANRDASGVNLREPILIQLMNMDPKKYQDWVHIPVIPTETQQLYLFEKKNMGLLEMHTHSKWYFVPLFWIPCLIWRFFLGYNLTGISFNILWGLLLGICVWSFTEYYLHGYLFHANTQHWVTNIVHFAFHGVHHLNPLDQDRLVFPPTMGLLFFALPLSLLAGKVFSPLLRFYVEFGFLIGYVCYDLTHYYLHHGTWMFGPLQYLKKCHMHHHFFSGGESMNFGVSLFAKPLDFLFGTNKDDL